MFETNQYILINLLNSLIQSLLSDAIDEQSNQDQIKRPFAYDLIMSLKSRKSPSVIPEPPNWQWTRDDEPLDQVEIEPWSTVDFELLNRSQIGK